MIEEQVVVTELTPEGAWIEGMQQSACGSCSAKAGCGQHALSQLGRKVSLWLPYTDSLTEDEAANRFTVGQHIVVGLPENAILRSTLVLYGVPLIFLIVGALFGNMAWGEIGSILFSITFMFFGFHLARHWSDKNQSQWQPQYIRDCESGINISVPYASEALIQTDKM